MGKGGICDGILLAVTHLQGVDALKMRKGGIRHGRLTAVPHAQGVDAL